MKIKKHEKMIQSYLTNVPHLRDDDMKLLATIWNQELKGMEFNPLKNTMAFLQLLADGKLSNPSSIRRCRAKLQELHPELRGQRYLDRQKKQTEEVVSEIKGWNNK
tara:strand:- start:1199 stop:1516 length:318 start_codon:yes stop_codon:yes gene_type:complete